MYIKNNLENVTGALLETKNGKVSDYNFPHEMSRRQQKAIDLRDLGWTLRDRLDVEDVKAHWFKSMENGNILALRITDNEYLSDEGKEKVIELANAYMEENLPENLRQVRAESGYQICQGDVPISLPIIDEKRAALGYNMLHAMTTDKVECDQFEIETNGERMPLDRDQLWVKGPNGEAVNVEFDKEWFGQEEDALAVKNAILDRYAEEAALDGEDFNREYEESMMDQYSVCCFDDTDNIGVYYAPFTWDMSKAEEMQNFMEYGWNPDVSMTCVNDLGDRMSVKADDTSIVCDDGDVYMPQYDNKWCVEPMPQAASFEDALDSIPTNDEGLTQ